MADDVWTALVKGSLAFAHSRAGDVVGDSFKDTGSLVTSLFDGSPAGTAKTRLEQLKTDIKNLSAAVKPIIDAVTPEVNKGKAAVTQMATELGTTPFTMAAAGRAAVELGHLLQALDRAMDIIADKIAEPSPEPDKSQIRTAIKGIKEPWIRPFRTLAAGATQLFDALCKQVLGIDDAGKKLKDLLVWDDGKKRISMELAAVGAVSPVPAIQFDGAKITAFFSFLTDVRLGVVVTTKLKAGMRGDKLLEKIIPGEPPTADTEPAAITLDTTKGITLGDNNSKITLPVRFTFPGVELREFALALPVDDDQRRAGKLDVMMTAAAKMGDVIAVVAEGFGVTFTLASSGGQAFSVAPRLPDGVGMRINAAVIKGGGYLRRKETEFGGVLDLQFAKIGLTAIGLLGTDPFSLVVVIGVRFAPKIELGWGFTLNGVGGILAIERRLNTDELRKGIREGTVDTLLFPEDPVASAPTILDKLGAIFPPQPAGFVIGPIAQLGWGSQAGFVKAKVGIVLSLPDPKLVLLGALEIAIPSTEVPDKLKILQLRAEVFGEFTPEFMLLIISINNSKIAGIPISGELGLFIRWAGDAAFALSVGGFFPKYKPPKELEGLRRIAIDLSPGVDWISIHAEGYFAVTANSVQFGGSVRLSADLSVASAKAWLSLDALFQWAPRFHFDVILDVGIEVKVFGATLCGVSFHGELQGTNPWRLEGTASVSILWWDVDVDIGPITWGESDTSVAPQVSPLGLVVEALAADSAWAILMPAGTDTLARLVPDQTTKLLVHPLGALEVRQQKVPLEVDLDRIGSSGVKARRVNLAAPQVGNTPAAAVANAYDEFAPGHFLNLTEDQQATRPDFEQFASGMQVSASRTPVYGDDAVAVGVPYEWETVFPHESFGRILTGLKFGNLSRHAFRINGVARAGRLRGNPYAPVTNPTASVAAATGGLGVTNHGRVTVRRREDLTGVAGLTGTFTTTEAARRVEQFGADADESLTLVAAGLTP
jgi:hypothetical protein